MRRRVRWPIIPAVVGIAVAAAVVVVALVHSLAWLVFVAVGAAAGFAVLAIWGMFISSYRDLSRRDRRTRRAGHAPAAAGATGPSSERKHPMSCGAGFFSDYVRERDRLYEQVQRRREKLRSMDDAEVGTQQIDAILDDIGELKLVVATMLNLLVRKGVLKEIELAAQAEAIDGLDGAADGRLRGHLEPDGTITPEAAPARTDLDDLADAARQ